jgi:hypothetical protein
MPDTTASIFPVSPEAVRLLIRASTSCLRDEAKVSILWLMAGSFSLWLPLYVAITLSLNRAAASTPDLAGVEAAAGGDVAAFGAPTEAGARSFGVSRKRVSRCRSASCQAAVALPPALRSAAHVVITFLL